MNFTRLLLIGSLLGMVGCRDFTSCFGPDTRLLDDHTLAGRTPSALTDDERSRGTYRSTDADLAPLQADLRLLGGTVSLFSDAQAKANGLTEWFDPRSPVQYATGATQTLQRNIAPFRDPISVGTLEDELKALCEHPIVKGRLPDGVCNGFGLNLIDRAFIDDLHLEVISRGIETFWDAPRTTVETVNFPSDPGACEDATRDDGTDFVRSRCSTAYDCPRDDDNEALSGTCVWRHECEVDADCKERGYLEDGVCTEGTCTVWQEYLNDESEQDPEAPVLVVRVPLAGDIDPNDFFGGLIKINVNRLTFDLRFQSVPCTGRGCRFRGDRIFANYRSNAPIDVEESEAGLDVYVRSTLSENNVSIAPGDACIFDPLLAITCGALLIVAEDNVRPAVARLGPKPARILEGLINIPNLGINIEGFGNLDLSKIEAGPELLPLAATDGAWTDDTLRLLTRGGRVQRGTLDLSRIQGTCNSCPDTREDGEDDTCVACRFICDRPLSTCDLSAFEVCVVAPGTADICAGDDFRLNEGLWGIAYASLVPACSTPEVTAAREDCTGTIAECDFDLDGLVGLLDPNPTNADTDGDGLCDGAIAVPGVCEAGEDLNGDGDIVRSDDETDPLDPCSPVPADDQADWEEARDKIWNQLSIPLPPSPNAAALLDGVVGFGTLAQRIFTRPVDDLPNPENFRYSDAWFCAAGDTTGRCADGSGAYYTFTADLDVDGVPDGSDNCPALDNPDQLDTDSDGFGDACDGCPYTFQHFNNPNDCNCDIDGDGCVNAILPPIDDAPPGVPRICELEEGRILDRNPTRGSGNHDDDEDGIPSDCDPDSDGDGVDDEDDNCPDVPNADQRDQNNNGIGDACDLCTAGQPICRFEPGAPSGFSDFDFGPGDPFECLAGGPCFGLLETLCIQGDCGFAINFADAPRFFPASAYNADAPINGALIPDTSGDGLPELAAVFEAFGIAQLIVIDPTDGEALFDVLSQDPGFGAALAVDGQGTLFVSAPDGFGGNGLISGFGPQGNLVQTYFGLSGEELGRDLAVSGDLLISSTTTGLAGFAFGQRTGDLQGPTGAFSVLEETLVVGDPATNQIQTIALAGNNFGQLQNVFSGEELFGPDARLGTSMSVILDDQTLRIAIGAPGAFSGAGSFALFDLNGQLIGSDWVGAPGSGLGLTVRAAGDLDGDGLGELIVGFEALDERAVLFTEGPL